MNKIQIKVLMIQECAKLMYFEGVKQYFDAKKIAAKRLSGKKSGNKKNQYFPTNGEIQEAIYQLSEQDIHFDREHVLFRMRLKALDIMQLLSNFTPRLIGSVSTGKIKQRSDIDLHVFCDEIEILTTFLSDNGILFEQDEVYVMKGSRPYLYQHIYFKNEFDIELSVYPVNEIRVTSRSSTDGKPIVRVSRAKLARKLEDEHRDMLNNNML